MNKFSLIVLVLFACMNLGSSQSTETLSLQNRGIFNNYFKVTVYQIHSFLFMNVPSIKCSLKKIEILISIVEVNVK